MKKSFFVLLGFAALVLSPTVLTSAAHAQVNCTGVAAWSGNSVAYAVGNLVTYSGSEYKCIQAHTSEAGWDPPAVGSLWTLVGACATTTGSTTGTCSAVPSAPATPTASSTTTTSTNLSWTAVTPPANCTITSYEVYKGGTALTSVTSGTSYTVTGLTASTAYTFTVAAVDSDGTSAQSAGVNVTTSSASCSAVPSAPATPSASGTTSTSTNLSWSAVTPPANCSISSYEVYKNGTALASTSGTSYAVTGLSASTTYKFTVAAVDSDGTGAQSSSVSVTTSSSTTGTTTGSTTGSSCYAAWVSATAYGAGAQVSQNNINYTAAFWSQGSSPATNSGPSGSGQPWISDGACGSTTGSTTSSTTGSCTATPSAPGTPTASSTTSSGTTLSWTAVTPPANCTITGYEIYENSTALASTTSTSYSVSGLAASTTYKFTIAAVDSDGTGGQSASVSVTTSSGGGGSVTTSGSVGFHVTLGVSSGAGDTITLTGGNYDDLIMSNVISGVMYSHIVKEGFPGDFNFNNDYLVGSDMGQLLQENLATEDYVSSSSLIDSNASQQGVMGAGQGGPYQINDYGDDMVGGTTTPAGHSLINYIAIQKNIGYTYANAANQYSQVTPPSFNNKYYGPMLPAFFHYNDMVSLGLIAGTPPWQPEYNSCIAHFDSLPNSFLDMILNVAYNQGYYGGLVASYSTTGETATASTVTTVDAYTSIWGNSSTYDQYPYQVHYYLDQLYDNPVPTTSATTFVTPTNHVAFPMATLEGIFSDVFQLLDYSNGTAAAQYFTASQATTAFNSALTSNNIASTATLDLSNASNRAQIIAVIDSAITNLESTSGMKFNATTTQQL